MPLPSPNLDDRTFRQMVDDSIARIRQTAPEWTDLSVGDPGRTLLEVFAFLTEALNYRLNRLPEKAYIEFLNLMGVKIQPPAAARVTLTLSRASTDAAVEIPRGTRVAPARAGAGDEPAVFTIVQPATMAAGQASLDVVAYHCDLVVAEQVGLGTGGPGQQFSVKRPPIIAPTGDDLDLVVGVETDRDDLGERTPSISEGGKTFRIWQEAARFANLGDDRHVYSVDRVTGTITFGSGDTGEMPAPEFPAAGKQVRVWYRRGGGGAGNVAANTLTTFKDPIAGLSVTNPMPAVGGRDVESLDSALARGPQSLFRTERAVTARDYEQLALSTSRAIARARALTTSVLWAHAVPGTVELLLVPHLPENQRPGGRVTVDALKGQEVEATRAQVEAALDERRPLGATLRVNWARYKTASVSARLVVRRQEDAAAVRQRVLDRLYLTINPLQTQFNNSGWPFGRALRASNVFEIALWEPGVRWVDSVRLRLEEVPDKNVSSLATDFFQPRTWYAASGGTLFRSLNDGGGWEPAGQFPGESIALVRAHPDRAGYVAVNNRLPNEEGTHLHISRDCGETWESWTRGLQVEDFAWSLRDGAPLLYLATNKGLYELNLTPDSVPVQILVDPSDQTRGFYAVVAFTDSEGDTNVAAASEETGGIYLSSAGGRVPYRAIGLNGQDIRELAVQRDSVRRYLWAGAAAAGDTPGGGCFRRELTRAREISGSEGWDHFDQDWTGGSCRAIAFGDGTVYAGSHHGGVLRLDSGSTSPRWRASEVTCNLPLRDRANFLFEPVDTLAASPADQLLMVGGQSGVFLSRDDGDSFSPTANQESSEILTLPGTWLFCSGEHNITVVSEDEANPHAER